MDSDNIHEKPEISKRKINRTIFASPIERANYDDEILYPRRYDADNYEFYQQVPKYKYIMALLVAAHNEELVLANTLRSAIAAGMEPQHIYVVDDASTDATSVIAKAILGDSNVIKVKHSGKGLALTKAAKKFNLSARYRWIHIADADGAFSPDYFKLMRSKLRVKYAAATGYVRSLSGSYIGQYRVFEYTIGLDFMRRFQAMTHVVSVIPGPTSVFRSDVLEKVNFANHSLTEDFDVTLQIHRQKLGNIQFIPQAVAYTQDPKNLKDYIKQITRWNRGTMQGVLRHKIGRRASRIDAYLAYRSRRSDIISAFPFIYILRWISVSVFLKCFIEVGLLRRHRVSKGVWSTAGRRYKIDTTPVLSEA
jgi:cellulose synthase/poly-beta-1,6-N-acetylglucosamine synthase-like glycosyltransferase